VPVVPLAAVVRREEPGDAAAVRTVHERAFGRALEADLLDRLRADTGWVPALSWVAVEDGAVVGHAAATRATCGGVRVVGLGPVGVLPAAHVDARGPRRLPLRRTLRCAVRVSSEGPVNPLDALGTLDR
jgi:predicted N-acetyltransferase YhbS